MNTSPATVLKATHAFTLNGIDATVQTVTVEAVDTLTVIATVRTASTVDAYTVVLRQDWDGHNVIYTVESAPLGDFPAGAVRGRIPFGADRRRWLAAYRTIARNVANDAAWNVI